jgi:hypothetical protein
MTMIFGMKCIPNVICHQACRVIGKIRVIFAAGDAPVAVKPVNSFKNVLVLVH